MIAEAAHNIEATLDEATGRWFYVCRTCWVTSWGSAPEVPCQRQHGDECCASGRCEVCTPGFVWGRDG